MLLKKRQQVCQILTLEALFQAFRHQRQPVGTHLFYLVPQNAVAFPVGPHERDAGGGFTLDDSCDEIAFLCCHEIIRVFGFDSGIGIQDRGQQILLPFAERHVQVGAHGGAYVTENVAFCAQSAKLHLPVGRIALQVRDLRQILIDDFLPVAEFLVAEKSGGPSLDVLC